MFRPRCFDPLIPAQAGNQHGRFVISARPTGSPHSRVRADHSQYGRSGLAALIEPLAHFLAGLEERHAFLVDRHMRAGARIAPGTRRTLLHRKGAEPAQLDAIAARHGGDDLAEDGVDDLLDVALVEMGILRRNTLHKFGLDHCEPWTVPCTASWTVPWTLSWNDWVFRNSASSQIPCRLCNDVTERQCPTLRLIQPR